MKESKVALLFVLIVVGGCFVWWFKTRPTYLLYQAHSQLGKKNQAAVIARYKRLLNQTDLPEEEEIRLRLALGEFYLEASGEFGTVVLRQQSPGYKVDHPFLALAKKEFDRVLELDSTEAKAHYNKGRLLLLKGLAQFAIDELTLAHEFEPRYPQPLSVLSKIYQDRGKPEKGRDLALQALAIDPQYDRARWYLVQAYQDLGEHRLAQKEYDRLSVNFKQSPEVRSFFALYLAEQNQWESAGDEIAQALERSPDDLWTRLAWARILIRKGDLEEATGHLAHAASLYKNSPWPFVWLTQANTLRQECREGRRFSSILMQALPRWPWSHVTSAWVQACEGEDQKALSHLDEALRLGNKFIEATHFKAEILLDKQEYKKLGSLLRPVLDQKRNQGLAYTLLARSLYHQGKWELSKEMAETAIADNRRLARPYLWLALSRRESGMKEAAERAFNQALRLNPFDEALVAYRTLGEDGWLDEAFKNERSNPVLFLIQGQFELKKDQNAEAIQSFQKALDLRPYLLAAHVGLIEAFWKQGNEAAADGALTKALKINSSDPTVLSWRKRIRKKS